MVASLTTNNSYCPSLKHTHKLIKQFKLTNNWHTQDLNPRSLNTTPHAQPLKPSHLLNKYLFIYLIFLSLTLLRDFDH